MRHLFLITGIVLSLGGCSAADWEDAFGPDNYTAEDDQECQSMGLAFGSPSYADCRMRLVEMREARKRAALQYYMQNSQPQQPQQSAPPPTMTVPKTTNCHTYGNTTNCTTW